MANMPTLDWPEPAPTLEEDGPPPDGGALVALGSAMVILGAIRLALTLIEYAHGLGGVSATGPASSRGWGEPIGPSTWLSLLIGIWPVALGLALRRTRWPVLVKAAALTFLALAIGGALAAAVDWNRITTRWITIGSFRVPRAAWGRPGTAGAGLWIAGAAQLVLEFATAAWALALAVRHHDEGGHRDDAGAAARRSWLGLLSLFTSVAFLVLTVRLPAWSTYLEVLIRSQWVREILLRDDLRKIRGSRPAPAPESPWVAEARDLYREGQEAWREGKYAAAGENYSHLAALLEAIPPAEMSPGERRLAGECLNNWAWLLATCPETGLRNYPAAVRHARRALELVPRDGNTWNTLGVSYYRLEDWEEALSALYRSMELRDEGDSADWFFLAMIHRRMGHQERARDWYNKAAQWARHYRPDDEELYRFQVEAAEALGLPRPERPPPRPIARMEREVNPMPPHLRGPRLRGGPQPPDGRWNPR
jgi:tetratricopeptide (TPR) repeat protein